MQGWIKLHREVKSNWLFQEKRTFSKFEAWVDLLLEVNHKDNKVLLGNELIDVKRGQTITSIRQLCDRWGWSNTKVKQFFQLLQNDGMITVKSDTKKTVVTVEKYDFYQCLEEGKTTQNTHENDTEQTQKHTNKNEKNEKEITTTANPVRFFESNLGMLSPFQMQEIWNWVDDFNGQSEILIYAMEIALDRNKKNMGFVKYLLKTWKDRGATNLDDVKALENERNNKGVSQDAASKTNKENEVDQYDFGF